MRGLKKGMFPLMVTSVLSIPLAAHAQFQSLTDEHLGAVTGQSGITIELSADVSIAELRYEDEGSLAIRNISIGGANKSTYFGYGWGPGTQSGTQLDNVILNVDVRNDGDLVVFARPTEGQAVDFAISTDEWVLQKSTGGDGTRLLNYLDMTGLALDLRMKVDDASGHLLIESTFGIDDLDTDIDFLGIGIQDMKVTGMSYFESLGDYGYVGIGDIGAELSLDIHTVDTADYSDVLAIDILRFETDIDMPVITLGAGPSIGRITINNLQLNNTSLVVYGH